MNNISLDYRHNGREIQSSTLSVPEQVMSSNHRSRSDVMRNRSRSPSVPPPHRWSALPHTVQIKTINQHASRFMLCLLSRFYPSCVSVSVTVGVWTTAWEDRCITGLDIDYLKTDILLIGMFSASFQISFVLKCSLRNTTGGGQNKMATATPEGLFGLIIY